MQRNSSLAFICNQYHFLLWNGCREQVIVRKSTKSIFLNNHCEEWSNVECMKELASCSFLHIHQRSSLMHTQQTHTHNQPRHCDTNTLKQGNHCWQFAAAPQAQKHRGKGIWINWLILVQCTNFGTVYTCLIYCASTIHTVIQHKLVVCNIHRFHLVFLHGNGSV